MNAGEFNDKISILSLTSSISGSTSVYEWTVLRNAWAKTELPEMSASFSNIGEGGRAIRFLIRKSELGLDNAMRWNGKHCFLTHISEIQRQYLLIDAALINPVTCSAVSYAYSLNQMNWPVLTQKALLTFPGFLTEKSSSEETYEQMKPMAETVERAVLVTPKVTALAAGTLIAAGPEHYVVESVHELDAYKNEYEIIRKADA